MKHRRCKRATLVGPSPRVEIVYLIGLKQAEPRGCLRPNTLASSWWRGYRELHCRGNDLESTSLGFIVVWT